MGLVLGLLVSNKKAKRKVLSLFYHYRYLNKTDLTDLPYINLITYRVKITSGTKLVLNKV